MGTLRVVRTNSGTPCCFSSARTPLLTAVGEISSLRAARVKLRSSATARNSLIRTTDESESIALYLVLH